MVTRLLWLPWKGYFRVAGGGYEPEGNIIALGQSIDGVNVSGLGEITDDAKILNIKALPAPVVRLAEVSALCNMSTIKKLTTDTGEQWIAIGDPTEGALQTFAHKCGLGKPDLETSSTPKVTFLMEFPFDSAIKRMSTIYHHSGRDKDVVFCKGSLEEVFSRCTHIMQDEEQQTTPSSSTGTPVSGQYLTPIAEHGKMRAHLLHNMYEMAGKGLVSKNELLHC